MAASNAFNDAVAYEGYVGRWSRIAGRQFIDWLNVPDGQMWLDFGAGTGILTQVILDQTAPRKVVGLDPATGFIERARETVLDTRAEFIVGDASTIAANVDEFDAAVAGLVLNFVPSPSEALHNMAQAVKRGGVVAAYVWDYAGRMEMIRHFWEAAIAIDPTAAELDSGKQFPICQPDNFRALFEQEALNDIELIPIDVQARFTNFEDFWLPFLGAQGSVSKYLRSLDRDTLSRISEQLHKQLPLNSDGTIDLILRAWAIKSIR